MMKMRFRPLNFRFPMAAFGSSAVSGRQKQPIRCSQISQKTWKSLSMTQLRPVRTLVSSEKCDQKDRENRKSSLSVLAVLCVASSAFLALVHAKSKEDDDEDETIRPGAPIDGLPTYSLEEVSRHSDRNAGIWIVYKAGVYDVTRFVGQHPGGDNILLGAGNSIEPFWQIYSQHHTPETYALLESYRIGNLREDDRLKAKDLPESSDIFSFVPPRDPALLVHHEKPFNAETPGEILVENFLTPNDKFFIRNHLSVPRVDPDEYRLEIEGYGLNGTFEFSLSELKRLFPKHTVTSVVQCGGNRRNDLNQVKLVKGIGWRLGAIGNTRWSGARLVDVLHHCGANLHHPEIRHVQFEGLDLDATSAPYGASIPADRALDPSAELILAYEMNGQPLPADHGFPVRLIAPGIVGARNVKWLGRIVLADHESTSHWQRNDYKSFPPDRDQATAEEFATAFAIQDMPVQSAICVPKSGDQIPVKQATPVIEARGYAWSGSGRAIIRVDVSVDGGRTWHAAQLEREPVHRPAHTYSWSLWRAEIPVPAGAANVEIVCRAVDAAHNTQPSRPEEVWNFRGLLNNSWHRVPVNLVW